ncbi:MAG: hypothetical protein NZ898_16440, partial [Myxococcota bacterium]|nr:hypothetical protein [Myxococcota bacterium]
SDSCVDGRCRREPRVGMSCDDGAFCTVMDACNAMGMCVGMARDCSDELACTTDRCNEAANRCEHTVTDGCLIDGACVAEGALDASNPCRACLPAMSRTAYSDRPNGTSCDDGVACTNDDRCMGGTCAGMDACAPQTCNRSTGTCM